MASTSYIQTHISSAASSSSPTLWDVFLSFRGLDTRYTFTDHLYSALDRHGVRTFRDDPELRSGEVISDALLQAIEKSKTYVVVFSENYASSRWCLDELAEILGCYKSMGRLVLPVFYNIDPWVVRYQIGSFKEAFDKHQIRYEGEMEKVKKWRLTLHEAAGFSGKHIHEKSSEADIINEIVAEILLKINPKTLDVAKYPVGLDSRVKDVTSMLRSGTTDVSKIGIYGMGGVGKTTLAKALYNQLLQRSFQGSCFLANVREVSGTTIGLVSLQQQLIDDVLQSKTKFEVHNVDQGKKLIGARIGLKKVLVVIDDIDHRDQYESLVVGPVAYGSVIIVTTRHEVILNSIEVEPRYRYMVKELDKYESLTLFNRHAFGNVIPNNTLMVLSKDILGHAGGLPLALEVFGSFLYKQSREGWEDFVEKLQRIPDSSIQKILMISFNAIDDHVLKKIFLDIACFFIGWSKERVVKILETYCSHADQKINNLKERCLLTINNQNLLAMHDLLRDMGREIARNNSPDEPGKHSRLWVSKDIYRVLKRHKGTDAIEGILYYEEAFKKVSLVAETFKRMSKLRFLHLRDINLTGRFDQIFEELMWLCWDSCPLKCFPSGFYTPELIILELRHSKLRTLGEPNMVFENLKTLDMSHSLDFTSTPDFTTLPCLETLELEGCKSLKEVHRSIGSLTSLVSLNLLGCESLKSLPDSICELRSLESLNIRFCKNLEELPIELGNIKSLKQLNGNGLNVRILPNSIGRLSKLVVLKLIRCKLKTLPDTICNLRALEVLDIGCCSDLAALPTELGNIKSLKVLNMDSVDVSNLPDSIGRLSNLVELRLSYNKNLKNLPDTICNLRSLEYLNISGCQKLEELPGQLWKITSLRELVARDVTLLKLESSQIPSLLKKLYLSMKILTALPSGISQLSNLEYLNLEDCCHLLFVTELPPNLKVLNAVGCTSMERLPNLSNFKHLEELNFRNCSSLTEIQGLKELTLIRELNLEGCSHLLSIAELPPNLEVLRANSCTSMERLPNLSNLKHLEELNLQYCSSLTEIQGLKELISMTKLHLGGCSHLLSIAELPPNLNDLRAGGCRSMERLPNLSNLKHLEELSLTDCSSLTEIQGLEELTSIRKLYLGGVNSSLLKHTFTKRFFQIYSGFDHVIKIYTPSINFPSWISPLSNLESRLRVSLDLLPNMSHNFLATILCINHARDSFDSYSVKNTRSGFIWRDSLYFAYEQTIIVPRSIFPVKDGDDRIEIITKAEILGIHLLYNDQTD